MNTPLYAPVVDRLGWAMLHSLWQGAIITLALLFVLQLLQRRSAAARHAACLLALLAMLTATIITAACITPRALPVASPASSVLVMSAALPMEEASPLETMDGGEGIAPPAEASPITGPPALQVIALKERIQPVLPWIAGIWI